MNRECVLVVDDDASFRRVWTKLLTAADYDVLEAANGDEARTQFTSNTARLVVLDLMLPPSQSPEAGKAVMTDLLAVRPLAKVVVVSGTGEIALGLELVRRGAYDFISKPVEPEVLLAVLERARARLLLEDRVRELEQHTTSSFDGLLGQSTAFVKARQLAERTAPTDIPVLLAGESGTGKEIFARFIHKKSRRHDKPFITVNCGALSPQLLESQLFGHKKGSFTGAIADARGLFIEANTGTLFLDEIGDMPLDLQVKLLRALESGEVLPVGASKPEHVNVRIISATHQPLAEMSKSGKFREDLYWRLKGIDVTLPKLSERDGDIVLLAQHFLNAARAVVAGGPSRLSAAAIRAIETYAWPGNLRELRHEMQRALVMSGNRGEILLEDLSPAVAGVQPAQLETNSAKTLDEKVAALERSEIRSALAATNGNRSKTAEQLGLSRQGLLNKMARYGLE